MPKGPEFHEDEPEQGFEVVVLNPTDIFTEAHDGYFKGNTRSQLLTEPAPLDENFFSEEKTELFLFKSTGEPLSFILQTQLTLASNGVALTNGGSFTKADIEKLSSDLTKAGIASLVEEGDTRGEIFLRVFRNGIEVLTVFPTGPTISGNIRNVQLVLHEITSGERPRSPVSEMSSLPVFDSSQHFSALLHEYAQLYTHIVRALYSYKELPQPGRTVFIDASNAELFSEEEVITQTSTETVKPPERKRLDFCDIIGQPEAVWEAQKMVKNLKNLRKSVTGSSATKSCLFVGEPGTGKTLLAHIIADQSQAEFKTLLVRHIAQEDSKWWGVAEAKLQAILDELLVLSGQGKRVVFFIDELDTLVQQRSMANSEVTDRLTQILLDFFQEVRSDPNIFLIAATNKQERLDPALRRAGRIDRIIAFYPFDTAEKRKELLLHYAGELQKRAEVQVFDPDLDWDIVAEATDSMSIGMENTPITNGADLDNLLNTIADDKETRLELQLQLSLADNPSLWIPVTTQDIVAAAIETKRSRTGSAQKVKVPLGFDTRVTVKRK